MPCMTDGNFSLDPQEKEKLGKTNGFPSDKHVTFYLKYLKEIMTLVILVMTCSHAQSVLFNLIVSVCVFCCLGHACIKSD